MDIKQFLYSIRNEAAEIKEIQMRIEELENDATGLKGISYDKVSVQTSPADRMTDTISKVLDYRNMLSSKIEELNDNRAKAQDMISRLEDSRERQVLDLYFLSSRRMTFSEVSAFMGYSDSNVMHNIYSSALQHLESLQ